MSGVVNAGARLRLPSGSIVYVLRRCAGRASVRGATWVCVYEQRWRGEVHFAEKFLASYGRPC